MMAIAQPHSVGMTAVARPIERLPGRKANGDQKEAMNCKSCRKRKIKCNRTTPSCEACLVFNCACIYDAIPKKRGPKTDVLEALLKRVNGLEKRLKDEQKSDSTQEAPATSPASDKQTSGKSDETDAARLPPTIQDFDFAELRPVRSAPMPAAPVAAPVREAIALPDALLDTYFARIHNKPYYILDETATRQRLRDGRLPLFLIDAIHAVAIRHVPHLCGGQSGAVRSSQDSVLRARAQIDVDEPNIDNLQALLLLAMANFQNGRGKRCYMVLTHAVSMAFALNLHRELPAELRIAPSEREGRRKLFWTCYLMDRFTVSGSKRPSLIADESIYLRLPAWQPQGSQVLVDGNYFPSAGHVIGASSAAQGSGAMLIEIVRMLGITNRYLAAGGVKGDSHFPWHAQSTLSRIRSDLDYWAAATQDAFASIDALFGSLDSSTQVLSKLIYHLIHCLIYRPFLPIDLAELSGTGQHQSWQIEATHLCFMHANAIAELVEIGKTTASLDCPSFVGYAVCTAGTIHVHGVHYLSYREGDAFSHSAEFLHRAMIQLTELRSTWAGVQHQRDTLQAVYANHAQLVKALSSSPMRFSPVFQMEDFFDRYPACYIDGAHVTFSDIIIDLGLGESMLHDHKNGWRSDGRMGSLPSQTIPHTNGPIRKAKKRRATAPNMPYPTPPKQELMVQSAHEEVLQHVPELAIIDEHNTHHDAEASHEQQNPMLFDGESFTAHLSFSPIPSALNLKTQVGFDPYQGRVLDQTTPGSFSSGAESGPTEAESDPFLSLLEQLAENDTTTGFGGHGDFDFYTGAQT